MVGRSPRILLVFLCILVAAGPALGDRAADRKAEKFHKEAWEAARKKFNRDIQSEDAKVRREAVLSLRDFLDLGAAELLVDKVLPVERNFGVMDAAIGVVGQSQDPKVVGWLVSKATGRGSWQIRAPVVEALAKIKAPTVDPALRKLLQKEKDPRVLSMAVFAVGDRKMEGGLDLLLPHLQHEDWQVRVAVIEAVAEYKDKKSLVPLIDALLNERGRLRQDLADALKSITGKNYGRDADLWRKWLNNPENPPPEPKPKGGQPAKPGPDGHATSKVDEPTYFGIKVLSERVLFIVDVSMSMKTPIDVDKMKIRREAARTAGDDEGEEDDKDKENFEDTIKWWLIKDRLDLAKAQLKFVIKNLKKNQTFEIVTFSESVTAWNAGRLMKASPRAKAKAVQFLDELDVEGATGAGAALDFAFELAGPGAGDKNYRSGVDTIFFLSDGAPTDRNGDEILEELRGRNKLRKVKVHVVAIVNFSVRFLRLLAEQNGGIYKFFKVEDK